MDNQTFTAIADVIKTRRTVKPGMMNGQKVPNEQVQELLVLADWAPTHAYTEPWRFVVYENPQQFCQQHAELYKQQATEENFNQATYNNLMNMGNKASHVVVAIMHRSELSKIPVFEEISAAACAVQNLLLGATALNIASFWSTGGATLKPVMKEFLGLGADDQVMGLLYLGYADEYPAGQRKTPLEEKIKWVQ
ncbi:nitroreductase [Mucilaginibacter sp. Bleaf8]|uniref:nitroreductase family protein n=1 Tax=Mucilaginibacter sp. Bleaf8 TaxID=2834430 RepID=UPI001BCD6E39|nr:nitroreductase [Mucilaginibacter sp. Bleaf8]MBS7563710.1 nitroreductase [Mucilaginibacter sp. Bleaf8]